MKLENFFVKTSFSFFTVRLVRLRNKIRFAANFSQFHRLHTFVICIGLFVIPFSSHASVLISEVAWMGTDEDANNEWIELYNLSGSETDLTGWSLTDGASISVTLAGTISPHGVAVLERTDDDTVPGTALVIYTGALSNSGGTLTLRNAEGGIADQAVGGDGWSGIGGSNTVPKKTAQRTRTGTWVTGAPTPYADNVQDDAVVVDDEDEEITTEAVNETVSTRASNSGSGSSSKKKIEQKELSKPELALTILAPKIVYVNQEIDFEVTPSGVGKTVMSSLAYAWNFGDTYTETGKKVTHIFKYPGEYVVVAHAVFAKQEATVRQEIKVLLTSFTLSRTGTGDIVLKNNSSHEVDLAGFTLRGARSFSFPKFTILKAGGTLTLSDERVGGITGVTLFDTQNVRVATDAVEAPSVKVKPPATTLSQKVSDQTLLSAETTEVSNDTPKLSETIIQIGNIKQVANEEGFAKRIFKKMVAYFNL